MLVESLGLVGDSPAELLESFDPATVPRRPWTVLG
jgi:glutamyl-tRNA synthetase